MKKTKLVLAVLLLATFAPGQWLEKTMLVPDTFCVGRAAELAWCAWNNRVYVGGGTSSVIAVDCATGARAARLDLGVPAGGLLWAATVNKLYALHNRQQGTSVSVVDVPSGQRLSSVQLPRWAGQMVWDSVDNRLYVAADSDIAVIDAFTNQLDTLLQLPGLSRFLCWNPVGNKLYSIGYSDQTLTVLACSTNSIIRQIATPGFGSRPVWHSPTNRLYMQGASGVIVIDAAADTVLGTVLTGPEPGFVVSNASDDKIYVGDEYGKYVSVIDGATNQVVDYMELDEYPVAAFWDGVNNRLVVASESEEEEYYLEVFDGQTNRGTGSVRTDGEPHSFCVGAVDRRVYTNGEPNNVLAFRPDSVDLITRIGLDGGPVAVQWSATSDRAYVADRTSGDVAVVDGWNSELLTVLPVPGSPAALAWNATGNKLYVGCVRGGRAAVFECDSHRLVAEPPVSSEVRAILWEPCVNKVYFAGGWPDGARITVVNGRDDVVNSAFFVPGGAAAVCRNSTNRKVYVLSSTGLYGVDFDTDVLSESVSVPGYNQAGWDSLNNKLFLVGGQRMAIVNAATSEVETTHSILGGTLFCHPSSGLAYVGRDNATAVFSGASNSQVMTIYGAGGVLGWNPSRNCLYASRAHSDSVAVIDCGLNRITGWFEGVTNPAAWAWNSTDQRAYAVDPDNSLLYVVRDTSGLGLAAGTRTGRRGTPPTVVQGVLWLSPAASREPRTASLLDVAGRQVVPLKPGANDVSRLAPGIYFVRSASGVERRASSVTRVVVVR